MGIVFAALHVHDNLQKGALLTSADAISRMENLPTPHQTDEEVDTVDAALTATVTPGRTLIEFDISSTEAIVAAGTHSLRRRRQRWAIAKLRRN
jgi:hypothetical protein